MPDPPEGWYWNVHEDRRHARADIVLKKIPKSRFMRWRHRRTQNSEDYWTRLHHGPGRGHMQGWVPITADSEANALAVVDGANVMLEDYRDWVERYRPDSWGLNGLTGYGVPDEDG